MITPDPVLLARISDDDDQAFSELFERYVGNVVSLANRYTGSVDMASDIAQDVFVRFWERRHQLPADLEVKAYLLRAARNAALDLAAHTKVTDTWAASVRLGWGGDEPGVRQSGEWMVERDEMQALVEGTLLALPPKVRETFLLHRDQGLKPKEIAEVLGVSPETVYVNLSRALKAMTAAVQEWTHR